MIRTPWTRLAFAGLLAATTSCSMHEKAVHWNGHVGPEGKPVFVLRSTYIGVHLAILLPVLGNTDIASMIDESTSWIRPEEGCNLRLIETESDNFWHGAPPLTWLITPVVTNITIEYQPTPEALARENVHYPELPAQPVR